MSWPEKTSPQVGVVTHANEDYAEFFKRLLERDVLIVGIQALHDLARSPDDFLCQLE